MKASESIKNFKPSLRMYANFAARNIKKICTEIGPREAGTQAELDAQNYMANQVGNAADEVKQEAFQVAPRALLGWLRIAGILLVVSWAAYMLNMFVATDVLYAPIVAIVSAVIILYMIFGEFLFYKEAMDFALPKATSHNTYCVRKAAGETKRRIIIGGHSDSSMEWRYTHLGGAPLMYFSYIYPVVGLAYLLFITVMQLVQGEINPTLIWINCAFLPAGVMLIFAINYKICVQGANDNLTGCMAAAAVIKFLGDNDIRFENTEVVALFSGAEESGLRGAKAAAKLHKDEYKECETMFLAIDTLTDYEDMAIYSKDMSFMVSHDKRVCQLLKKASANADVDLKFSAVFAGASDAAAMTQAGIPSTCLAAMNPGPPKYYHTRDDKPDILNLKTIEKGVEIALETVFLFDEKGLQDNYD